MINFKLKELIEKHNLTIADVHRVTGISRSSLAPLINNPGDVKAIRTETLDKLCSLFGVDPSEIIEFVPNEVNLNVESMIATTFALKKRIYNIFKITIRTGYLEQIIFLQIKAQYYPDTFQFIITSRFIEESLANAFVENKNITREFDNYWTQEKGYEFFSSLSSQIIENITNTIVKLTKELFEYRLKEYKNDFKSITFHWERTENLPFPYPHKTLSMYNVIKDDKDSTVKAFY